MTPNTQVARYLGTHVLADVYGLHILPGPTLVCTAVSIDTTLAGCLLSACFVMYMPFPLETLSHIYLNISLVIWKYNIIGTMRSNSHLICYAA